MKNLPFTYNFENSTSVQKQTNNFIKKNKVITKRLTELSWAYHSIRLVIPQTKESYWSGHYFPYLESFTEFEISFLLCSQGFYKQSMVSLRSVLENGLLSVYYNINDEGHKTVQGWLQSQDGKQNNTPYFNTIWKILIVHPNIQKFQKVFDIKTDLLNLQYLHDYVHSKGLKYSNQIGLFKSNRQTFEKIGFLKWFETAHKVVKTIIILHLLKFPLGIIEYDYSRKFGVDMPTFGGLDSFHIERIKFILGAKLHKIILTIVKEDEGVLNFLHQIENMPDITEEEIAKQTETINRILKRASYNNKNVNE